MSRATKRKHVLRELFEDDYSLPTDDQKIVKVLQCKGNNLIQVQSPENEEYLVSLPSKFRRNVWVRRGQYVLVEPIAEGNKVKGEIVRVLNNDHIKEYSKSNIWPAAFSDATENKNAYDTAAGDNTKKEGSSDSESDRDDSDLIANPNRPAVQVIDSESCEDYEDDDSEGSEGDDEGSEDSRSGISDYISDGSDEDYDGQADEVESNSYKGSQNKSDKDNPVTLSPSNKASDELCDSKSK